MPHHFVDGSLKQGFPKFHVNRGRRVAGEFKHVGPLEVYTLDRARRLHW